mmetsp:Transcript_8292/g.12676  ORF Transcript_8292/g.12676 Transcript_8292/m.12676 type:complete len:120 (+) Transcript_8292:642-1001(+)
MTLLAENLEVDGKYGVYVENKDGKIYSIVVPKDARFKDLKDQLHLEGEVPYDSMEGSFFMDDQQIEGEDSQLLSDLGIIRKSKLFFNRHSFITLFVKTLVGSTLTIRVEWNGSIEQVKH